LISPAVLLGQEMLGISASKYGGIHNTLINPSLLVLSPSYLDLNIITGHLFIENNYIYIRRQDNKYKILSSIKFNQDQAPYIKTYYDYYTPEDKYGYINARILGPSIGFMIGRHAFGITTGVRSVTSLINFPMTLAKFFYEGFYYPPQQNIRYDHSQRISATSLSWAETGITYSGIINSGMQNILTAGISVKYLLGFAGEYVKSDNFDFMVQGSDTLIVYDADVEGGLAAPINYYNNQFMQNPLFKGRGLSFDVGVTFEKKKDTPTNSGKFTRLCAQKYSDYQYRIGLSLLDIGEITFNSNTVKLGVKDGQMFWPGVSNASFQSTNSGLNNISLHFFGDTSSLITGNKITIFLPAALSIQTDINITNNWFVNGIIIVPFRVSNFAVMRSSLLAAGIKYETSQLSYGTNVSIYNLDKIHLGLFGRFHEFFLGTENVLSFLNINDFTGTDLYAGVKISLRKGHCKSSSSLNCEYNEYKNFIKKKKRL
jgi:hypothetical protein